MTQQRHRSDAIKSEHPAHEPTQRNHYLRLGVMSAFSFVSMYVLMYAMVDSGDAVYHNVNQIYMAGLMTAPMVVIELALMRGMFRDKRLNALLCATAVLVSVAL